MPTHSQLKRDKKVTRATHTLFLRALVKDKFAMTLGLLQIGAVFVVYVYIPLLTAYALQAIITRQFGQVTRYGIEIAIASLAYCLFVAVSSWGMNRAAVAGASSIQNEVFENYLQKDYEFYGDNYVGALGAQAARLRDGVLDYHLVVFVDGLRIATVIVAGISVIAYKSPPLALITLFCMLFVLSFNVLFARYRLKYRREVSEASSHLSALLGDALTHGTTVKSFAAEEYEKQRLRTPVRAWQAAQRKSWDLFIPAASGRNVLSALTIVVLLLFSAHLYQQGTISIAVIALIQLYMVKLISLTSDILELIKTYEKAMAAAYQPVATMLVKSTVTDPVQPKRLTQASLQNLSFNSIHYHYPDMTTSIEAVSDFSLTIQAGEKIGLVGYSGSGKTTLTKLLLRFMDVTKGRICLDDVDIRDVAQQELRKHIAYVPQEPLLFHRSIAENIAYPNPKASVVAIARAAKLAYVDEFVDELPRGYKTLVGERGIKLSGGQRQRVAIARALLKDAPILVLDEATSALDSHSEQLIQKALWKLMKGRTALVIAHRLSTIQHMDKIVVMDKGRIIQTGTHDELLKDTAGIYAQLWAHQSGGYIGVSQKNDDLLEIT